MIRIKKATLIFVLFVLVCSFNVFATMEVASPEASSFSRVESSEPGPDGNIGFSIPVGTVPGRNGMNMPLSLGYGAGIKLDQEASWVGLGFSLGVGAVTRSPVGVADDYVNGFFRGSPSDGDYNDQDYYSVSFPGGEGKIIFDDDKVPHFANWQNYNISAYDVDGNTPQIGLTGEIVKWIITDMSGTRYVFDKVAYSRFITEPFTVSFFPEGAGVGYSGTPEDPGESRDNSLNHDFASSWYLTEILSADYVDAWASGLTDDDKGSWIKIEYDTYEDYKYLFPNPRVINCAEMDDVNCYNPGDPLIRLFFHNYAVETQYSSVGTALPGADPRVQFTSIKRENYIDMVYPSNISTPMGHANFSYDFDSREDGRDFSGTPKKLATLNSVNFYNYNNELLSRTEFNYAEDGDELAKDCEGDPADGRLTLESVVYYGNDGTSILPEISFDYFRRDMPYDKFAWDWWGYYNGQISNDNYDFTAFYASLWGSCDYTFSGCIDSWALNDENHEATDYIDTWSVSRVNYSTGGSIEYDYEVGSYSHEQDTSIPTVNAGIRLANKTVRDGMGTGGTHVLTINYIYGDGVTTQDLGWKSHYRQDWERFGSHLGQGIYYENVTKEFPGADYGSIETDYYIDVKENPLGFYICVRDLDNDIRLSRKVYNSYNPYPVYPGTTAYKNNNGALVKTDSSIYSIVPKFEFIEGNVAGVNYNASEDTVDCNAGYTLNVSWMKVDSSFSTFDGMTNQVDYIYDLDTGLPRTTITHGNTENIVSYVKYAHELDNAVGNGMEAKNMLSQPLIQTISSSANLMVMTNDGTSPTDYSNVKSLSYTQWADFGDGRYFPSGTQAWKDVNGNEDVDSGEMQIITRNMEYNKFGALTSAQDPLGHTTTMFYGTDTSPCVQNIDTTLQYKGALPTCLRNSLSQDVISVYDLKGNLVLMIDSENDASTGYDYDAFGRLTETYQTDLDTGEPETTATTTYQYYYGLEDGGLSGICQTDLTCSNTGLSCEVDSHCDNPNMVGTKVQINDDTQIETRTYFDGLGRDYQTQAVMGEEDGLAYGLLTINTFNEIGKISSTSKPIEMPFGQAIYRDETDGFDKFVRIFTGYDDVSNYVLPEDVMNAMGDRGAYDNFVNVLYKHDPLARVDKTFLYGEAPASSTVFTLTEYDGNSNYRDVAITDAEGTRVTSYSDKLGRQYKILYPDGNFTRNYYDTLGNLLYVEQSGNGMTPERVIIRNTYDTLGRVKTTWDIDSGNKSFRYDQNGNVICEIIFGRSEVELYRIGYEYDSLNRLKRIDYDSCPVSTAADVTYTYDSCTNGVGRLCNVVKSDGYAEVHSYDRRGRLIQVSYTIDETPYNVYYQYDNVGNVEVVTDNDNYQTKYVYNNLGQIDYLQFRESDSVSWSSAPEVDYNYTNTGSIDFIEYPEVTTDYTYNVKELLSTIDTTNDSGSLFYREYQYDDVGNLEFEYDGPSLFATYDYDNLYQLIDVSYSGLDPDFPDTIEYRYDAFRNRRQKIVDGASAARYFYEYMDGETPEIRRTDPNHLERQYLDYMGPGKDFYYKYDYLSNLMEKEPTNLLFFNQPTKYNYDKTNMLTEVVLPGAECMKFWYDASGRRIKKWEGLSGSNGEKTIYIYGASGLNPLTVYTDVGDQSYECSEIIYSDCSWKDYDGDGWVTPVDLSTFAASWEQIWCNPNDNWCEFTDFNLDGNVDPIDLSNFASCFGLNEDESGALGRYDCSQSSCEGMDFNKDGIVTTAELFEYLDLDPEEDYQESDFPQS